MKVEYNSDGYRDFSQRYSGTYGWLEREGKESLLVKLLEVDHASLKFMDKRGMEFFARPDMGNYFSFLPVVKGSYLYKDDIVVVQRRPARQWKRGICEDNTSITKPSPVGEFKDSLAISFEVLDEIFYPKPNFSVSIFRETRMGNVVLFNHQFSIYKGLIYVYDMCIGKYENGKFILNDGTFLQEIQDLITMNKLDMEVA